MDAFYIFAQLTGKLNQQFHDILINIRGYNDYSVSYSKKYYLLHGCMLNVSQ